jgi:hypothetical protein
MGIARGTGTRSDFFSISLVVALATTSAAATNTASAEPTYPLRCAGRVS